jgi:hypothetical protein
VAEIGLAEEHQGPNLVQVAIVHAGFFLGGGLLFVILAGATIPSPFAPRSAADGYFAANPVPMQVLSFFELGGAIPLAIFTAAVVSRLLFLGVRVAGVHIALVGGILASAFQAAAGCAHWVLGQPGVSEIPAVTRPLHLIAFAAGGPASIASFGLLVAGVSAAAGLARLVPRWLMLSGLVLAGVAEISVVIFLVPALSRLPGIRLVGFAWMICIGTLLPKAQPAALPPA